MNRGQLIARTRMLAGAEMEGLRHHDELGWVVDESYQQIAYLRPWKWRETTVTFDTESGKASYDVPAEVEQVQSVQVLDAYSTSGRPVQLREVPLRDLLTEGDRQDEGSPRVYAREGEGGLRLAKTPSRVYTVEVLGLAPVDPLDDDDDEPAFASRFHPAVAYLSAATVLEEEGELELAEARRAKTAALVEDMERFYQSSDDLSPIVVGGGGRRVPADRRGRLWPWRG